jgi:hypothetical protein
MGHLTPILVSHRGRGKWFVIIRDNDTFARCTRSTGDHDKGAGRIARHLDWRPGADQFAEACCSRIMQRERALRLL